MSATNDGGPAFPIATKHVQSVADREGVPVATVSKNLGTYPGMSLRDWYAGMALQGYMAYSHPQSIVGTFPESAAETAYQCADAMIAARERKGGA
jgi:hypothetical protein